MMNKWNYSRVWLLLCFLLYGQAADAQLPADDYLVFSEKEGSLPVYYQGQLAPVICQSGEYSGVAVFAEKLQQDFARVTGAQPALYIDSIPDLQNGTAIIVGVWNQSPLIQDLLAQKKLNIPDLAERWEQYYITSVKNPLEGVAEAVVIVGSDKRGTIYGMMDWATEMGVSPWHYWADVPVRQQTFLGFKRGLYTDGEPDVKYRGIFLNDEAPALRGWAEETFGGFNHQFYEKVFDLILRLKGNYLWPAMWRPAAFAADDPENAALADQYGVVISTSHHEPMMRAHDEWSRFGGGDWNYLTNKEQLKEFWRGGIERMGNYESVVTLGMRGDGDEAMREQTAVNLLQTIIQDQRQIIEEVTGQTAQATPQVWAIYKEVQDYYDQGMRVADDVMVLFCDDNWGNIRILPAREDREHPGGYGMYYHFDFVGGPVSYRWLNVTQLERVWEQMKLSYDWGVDDLWIVNVGDLKPMELPISFFLDFAWNAGTMDAEDLPAYYRNWARQQFGAEQAEAIAAILALYTKYNARRTPEMLQSVTYSLSNYREAERVLGDYRALLEKCKAVQATLPGAYQDAFFQLVRFPVEASCNLYEMYIALAKHQRYAQQGRASANYYADRAREFFFADAQLTDYFHHQLSAGKWNHMMAQTHIGYTSWNNPPFNKMPALTYVHNPEQARMGYVVEHGLESAKSNNGLLSRSFSNFDSLNQQTYYLEIFNQGREDLNYTLCAEQPWIKLSDTAGTIAQEGKVLVGIDWDKVPAEAARGAIRLAGAGQSFTIQVPLRRQLPAKVQGFLENNGVVAIEAGHFTKVQHTDAIRWQVVPNLGRTTDGLTIAPADAPAQTPGPGTPWLEYTFTLLADASAPEVETYLSPTLNYQKGAGLRYAIAIDDELPQLINIHQGEDKPDWTYPAWWNDSVTEHIKRKSSTHNSLKAGVHTLKIWMVDPGLVFQKFVINTGGLRPSYLGPPESKQVEE